MTVCQRQLVLEKEMVGPLFMLLLSMSLSGSSDSNAFWRGAYLFGLETPGAGAGCLGLGATDSLQSVIGLGCLSVRRTGISVAAGLCLAEADCVDCWNPYVPGDVSVCLSG